MANVSFIRWEVVRLFPQYRKIRDCLAGETRVKEKRQLYLPMPNSDQSHNKSVLARYNNYLERAVYYNVPRRTLSGLVGTVFMRKPTVNVPTSDSFDAIVKNASGSGSSLDHEAKKLLDYVLAYSRGGVLVDYPDMPGGANAEQVANGEARPTISIFAPMEVINWRIVMDGAIAKLSLVVIAEMYAAADDGFEIKNACQFRVLRLDPQGNYIQEIWRENDPSQWDGYELKKNVAFRLTETYFPKGADGQPLKEIPFMFCGSQNNDPAPDNPNFYDLCSLSLAHYRNSADYEECCYITGQATPVVTGITQEWLKDVLGGEIRFGSTGGIPLPENADAKLIQAQESSMLKEAMDAKERQMVALGAKLVEQKTVQRTATEASIDNAAANSVLGSCANNVSDAITWALKTMCKFTGDSPDEIEYKLSNDYSLMEIGADQQKQIVADWQSGAITFGEMRTALRRGGLATEDDEIAQADMEETLARQAALLAKTASVGKPTSSVNEAKNL